jgi:IS605 OrfB family transposase
MRRSKGTVISVKVPIKWGIMTDRQKARLSQITGRDTRVIKAYLGVIECHENALLTGHRRNRIVAGKLDELTLTATRGAANRHHVPHDFKKRFPNISANEFQECRDTAMAMWHSYLERGGSKPLRARGYTSRKIPRFAFKRRFEFVYTSDKEIKHWLVIRDSLDSAREGRKIHDRLAIPLSPSSFHLRRLGEGEIRTVRLFKDRFHKWWAIFTVTLTVDSLDSTSKLPAVLAIDLGIKKTACTVLLTQKGYKQVRYWKQDQKRRQIQLYDERVASLQRRKEDLLKAGMDLSGVAKKLRDMSRKRVRVSIEYDKKMVKDISDHILEMIQKYDLHICIGRVKGIRNKARKDNYKGRAFRGMIHRWSFARVTELLRHKLEILGYDSKRFKSIPESWTSIKCHKCGHKGIRPKQNLFICHTCGYRANADLNGAINIGRRLIMLIPSLRDEKGLGMWLLPREKATLNARRSIRSKGKSSLPQRSPALLEGESVADCYDQISPEESVSSNDPAMVNTVEIPPAAASSGNRSFVKQRTETWYRQRDNVPVRSGKAHVTVSDSGLVQAGDSSREKGGTQKFLNGSLNQLDN